MKTTLDTLTTFNSELTAEQLDDVDGGFVVLVTIAVLSIVDGALWHHILAN